MAMGVLLAAYLIPGRRLRQSSTGAEVLPKSRFPPQTITQNIEEPQDPAPTAAEGAGSHFRRLDMGESAEVKCLA